MDNNPNNVTGDTNNDPFTVYHIKIEHFYFSSGDIDHGGPIATSVEISQNFNFQTFQAEWTKIVAHTYYDLENGTKHATDTYTEKIENADALIAEIQKNDLRNLKNNYFTDMPPHNYSHWELSYNYYFKIAGTYDQEIPEFKRISEILNFEAIMKQEQEKIKEKINNKQNNN